MCKVLEDMCNEVREETTREVMQSATRRKRKNSTPYVD